MTPEQGALKIALYFAECERINAQPRILCIAQIIDQCKTTAHISIFRWPVNVP